MMHSKRVIFLITVLGLSFGGGQTKDVRNSDNELDLTIFVHQDRSGHYVTNLSLNKGFKKMRDNLKFNVKANVMEHEGRKTYIIKLKDFGLTPKNDRIKILPNQKPEKAKIVTPSAAGYEHFPGIGYYKFYSEGAPNFHKAMEICKKDGAHLAIINSEAESKVLAQLFSRHQDQSVHHAYIGFHDIKKEGEYVTIFGEPLRKTGFDKWNTGEPNQARGNEDCGSIARNGLLNDLFCDSDRPWPFICEYKLSWI